MNMSSNLHTGTATKAADVKAGQRVLIGVDTKMVKNTTTIDGITYMTIHLPSGKLGYRTFPATRTFYVY